MINIIRSIIISMALIIGSVYDIKTKTIPLWLFPTLFLGDNVLTLFESSPMYIDRLIGALIGGITFIVLAYFGGGGGDIIMMAVLGWCIGSKGIVFVVLCASILCFAYSLILRAKKDITEIPFAPFAMISVMLFFLRILLKTV